MKTKWFSATCEEASDRSSEETRAQTETETFVVTPDIGMSAYVLATRHVRDDAKLLIGVRSCQSDPMLYISRKLIWTKDTQVLKNNSDKKRLRCDDKSECIL